MVSDIEINADSLEFKGENLNEYITCPLERLVLKPYQLDYQDLLLFFSNSSLNKISEL